MPIENYQNNATICHKLNILFAVCVCHLQHKCSTICWSDRERARESERDTTSLQLALWNELNRAALDVQMFSLLYFASVCFVSVFVFGFRFSWCGLPIYNIGMLFHATRFGCYRTKPSKRCIWCAVSLFLFPRHTLQCVRASLYGTVIARFIFQIHTQHPVSVARL